MSQGTGSSPSHTGSGSFNTRYYARATSPSTKYRLSSVERMGALEFDPMDDSQIEAQAKGIKAQRRLGQFIDENALNAEMEKLNCKDQQFDKATWERELAKMSVEQTANYQAEIRKATPVKVTRAKPKVVAMKK